jgi:2-keto-4-pentenoate hydratase
MPQEASRDPRIASGMQSQLATLRARREAGAKSLGWKVGFGAPAAMERLGISAPLIGFLTDAALVSPGARVSLAGWTKPVAEPEIAVVMGRDLNGGASREEASAAVSALAPSIELADLDRAPDDVTAILAGNIYQRHVILGPADHTRAGGRLDNVRATVRRSGKEIASTTDPQALTGDHIEIVRHVARTLEAFGERLSAGHIIITGSITPPLFVEPGEDLVFDLSPIGTLAVSFER